MLIQNWMSSKVITATADSSMHKISKQMKDFSIRRVPVIDSNNKVIGIISDRDIRDASPSKATTLNMHELSYLLSEIKAKDIMTQSPVTVRDTDTVEQVALLMLESKLTGLPVVDEENTLVGIITEHDMFKVLVEISGARQGGIRFTIEISNDAGSIPPVLEMIKQHNARLISMLSGSEISASSRHLFMRIRPLTEEQESSLKNALTKDYKLLTWACDYKKEL